MTTTILILPVTITLLFQERIQIPNSERFLFIISLIHAEIMIFFYHSNIKRVYKNKFRQKIFEIISVLLVKRMN